jgi:hypothetical protein
VYIHPSKQMTVAENVQCDEKRESSLLFSDPALQDRSAQKLRHLYDRYALRRDDAWYAEILAQTCNAIPLPPLI